MGRVLKANLHQPNINFTSVALHGQALVWRRRSGMTVYLMESMYYSQLTLYCTAPFCRGEAKLFWLCNGMVYYCPIDNRFGSYVCKDISIVPYFYGGFSIWLTYTRRTFFLWLLIILECSFWKIKWYEMYKRIGSPTQPIILMNYMIKLWSKCPRLDNS